MPAQSSGPVSRDWWWIFDPRESLRARAALVCGGGAVLFTLLIAWIGSSIFRHHLQSQLGSTFETLAVQVSNSIDRRLYERYRELQFIANLTPLRDRQADVAERRRALDSLRTAVPEFAWIGFADRSGQIVAATRGLFERESVREHPWFVGAQERPYAATLHELRALTDALPERDTDARVFDFAIPVTGVDGEFAGVLGAHLRWGWSRDIQLAIVPESSARELIGVTVYGGQKEVLLDSGASGWTEPPDPPVLPPRHFRGFMLEKTTEGSVYLTGYVRSRGQGEYRGLGWLTTVRQPVARALAPARELQLTIARWGFGFSALLGTISWVFAGRMARRLEAVRIAAGRIRKGDILTIMPQPRGTAEVDYMCGAVSELVEELRPRDPKDSNAAQSPPGNPAAADRARPDSSDPRRVVW
ncbi:MAG: cache domain-containing protein [Opitutaceae bacterium]|nr:cache domain-containing protein [Opitutaceae bacterium]